jgi:hypothetical protein
MPRRAMKARCIAAFSIVFITSMSLVLSPYVASFLLKRYVDAGNVEGVKSMVDFAAARDSLRMQSREYLEQHADKKGLNDDYIRGMMIRIGTTLVGDAIDKQITPEGLGAFLGEGVIADGMFSIGESLKDATDEAELKYDGPSRFQIIFPNSSALQRITMERRNLVFWHVVELAVDFESMSLDRGASRFEPNSREIKKPETENNQGCLSSSSQYVDRGPGDTLFVIRNCLLYADGMSGLASEPTGKPQPVSEYIIKVDETYYCEWERYAKSAVESSPRIASGAPWICRHDGIHAMGD